MIYKVAEGIVLQLLLLQLSPFLVDTVSIPGRGRPGLVKAAVGGKSGDAALHIEEKHPQRQGEAFKTLLTHNRTVQKVEPVALQQAQQSIEQNSSGHAKMVQAEQREQKHHEAASNHTPESLQQVQKVDQQAPHNTTSQGHQHLEHSKEQLQHPKAHARVEHPQQLKVVEKQAQSQAGKEAGPMHGTLHELLHKQHEDLVTSQRKQKNHVQAHGHLGLDDHIQGAAKIVARGAAVDVGLLLVLVGAVVAVVLYTLQNYPGLGVPSKGEDEEEEMWPGKLFVECDKKQYAGTYLRIKGEMPNGNPLWKRDGSNDWVFCGTGGQWFVGDEDEKQLGFQCSRGNIASVEENGGRMPDEIGRGGWLFYDGEKWTKDDSINITSELFTAKDQEEAFKQSTSTAGDEGCAATKIQSLYRGKRDRRRANAKKLREDEAKTQPPSRAPALPTPAVPAPAPASVPDSKTEAVAAPTSTLAPEPEDGPRPMSVEPQDRMSQRSGEKDIEKTVEKKPGFLARASTAVKRTTSRSPRPSGRT